MTNKKRKEAAVNSSSSDDETSSSKNKRGKAPAEINAAETTVVAQKTPYERYFDKLKAFTATRSGPHKILGRIVTRGIVEDDDDDDDDATENYTAEQMQRLRIILITPKRADALEEMDKFVLGDQAGKDILGFTTSFSYEVRDSLYYVQQRMRSRTTKWSDKFDLLLGYTHALQHYDAWMCDNEGGMEGMVKGLARLWKNILKRSDEDLGIDGEYTRPGVMAMLESFQESIESAESDPPFRFRFK